MFELVSQDSVIHLCFSHDGTLLATGDYAGYIQVWEVASSKKVWEFEVGELSVSCYHHHHHEHLSSVCHF